MEKLDIGTRTTDVPGKKIWVDPEIAEVSVVDHTRSGPTNQTNVENVAYKIAS